MLCCRRPPVVTLPVVYTSSRDGDVTDDVIRDVHRPYIRRVALPSFDPWTLYLDRSHSALVALALDSGTKATVTRSRSHAKSAIDRFITDVSRDASLWSGVESESLGDSSLPQCGPPVAVKPLYLLAAECREKHDGSEQITDLKQRLTEVLGKLNHRTNSMPPS